MNRLGKIQEVPSGYRFRCPYCGDSQKSQSKARGHVVEKWRKRFFKCHNCRLSKSFGQFLKDMDADLYAEYVNQECPERYLEDAAAPLKEEEGVYLRLEEELMKVVKISNSGCYKQLLLEYCARLNQSAVIC